MTSSLSPVLFLTLVRNYSVTDIEALAIIFTKKKFYEYIYDRKFTLVADNISHEHIMGQHDNCSSIVSAGLIRWINSHGAYDYDINNRQDQIIKIADALSRLPLRSRNDENIENGYVKWVTSQLLVDKM
ncbi:hypothetical protein RF11_15173 [Thelohanellus kitauei]|uniref:Reverse transcriptase RNase H-like domain-containing protein n=1 Tax=Thelohanellus kitauei TaxID=669202 RepID=A0A0C2N8N1_THEKT|nr:hypothetical protein RF11_15173 [Thelohanellus kitauei]